MSQKLIQDKDLESLESSLAAIESENTGARLLKKYGVHRSWIYYYIAFLGLSLLSIILVIINFSVHPEEPMFLSLQENIIHREAVPVFEIVKQPEVPVVEVSEKNEKPKQDIKVSKPLEYHFYTPEELQKIANQVTSETSEEFNLIKAEVFSLLGWFGNSQKFKKDGMDFANRLIQANSQDLKNPRAPSPAEFPPTRTRTGRDVPSPAAAGPARPHIRAPSG